MKILTAFFMVAVVAPAFAADLKPQTEVAIAAVQERVVAWRRDIHRHPELSNREARTANLVAQHLRSLGMEVRTGMAHHGVVGILRGGRPGPVVALRADMDALPVTERTGLPFASIHDGVMHACGHDAHTAMLMGAAEVLAGIAESLSGTVMFVFQPAEEGPPPGEEGGAQMMVAQGLLEGEDAPEAIFGLHVYPFETGTIQYREGGFLASADRLEIHVRGRQAHGSSPWAGVDPVIVSAQIMTALQAIPSRQLDVTRGAAVVSIGVVRAGSRWNIIPDEVFMEGTIRTHDPDLREEMVRRVRHTATHIAEAAGATAEVIVEATAPVTWNDPAMTRRILPSLQWAAGADKVSVGRPVMVAEDFAFFQEKIPGSYFLLGVNRPGIAAGAAPSNHSPEFDVHEPAMQTGVRAFVGIAIDYLSR